ncbi:RRP15-like protein [Tubulanus polymorphus]|uniref:RRP15-like protein n=1 Tax=Tubulanus polymorphus TaxID=672921 RepID=UPI003DA49766
MSSHVSVQQLENEEEDDDIVDDADMLSDESGDVASDEDESSGVEGDDDEFGLPSSDEGENEDESREPSAGGDTTGKKAMADVLSKILNKSAPKKSTILSKGETDRERTKKKQAKESDGVEIITAESQTKRSMWEKMGRKKPDITKREHERNLQRIATRGIVQLFNAVKKQQKLVEEKLSDAGPLEHRKDKAMKAITKGAFLDVLRGTEVRTVKDVEKESQEPSWKILRDDFMMGAKMKDWDKDSDEGDDT